MPLNQDCQCLACTAANELYEELKMEGFTAMDQKEAGIAADKQFLKIKNINGETSGNWWRLWC